LAGLWATTDDIFHSLLNIKVDAYPNTTRRKIGAASGQKEMQPSQVWQKHADPVATNWPQGERILERTTELERRPGVVAGRPLRKFSRRVSNWRWRYGPSKEGYSAPIREEGQNLQFDSTNANELGVNSVGRPYAHALAHAILPSSNWESPARSQPESVMALKVGMQESFLPLRGVTRKLQTYQSSTATRC
jgi:hypothetical protein